jgi:methylaspartate mutase epsilon subunit
MRPPLVRIPQPAGRLAVLTGVSSDAHTWNLVYLHLLLEELGWEVVGLGATTPDEAVVQACLKHRPDLLVVSSVNGHGHIDGARMMTALRERSELAGMPAVIGGKLGVAGEVGADRVVALLTAGVRRGVPGRRRRRGVHRLCRRPRRRTGRGHIMNSLPAPPPVQDPVAVGGSFAGFVATARHAGELVVQPRMGFAEPEQMRAGLLATRAARATTVGTITVDSYTRVRDYAGVARALDGGLALNGYPLVSHPPEATARVLDGIAGPGFPVQIRHGSAQPCDIVATLVGLGLDATEGGPISYCLPYGRVPVEESIREWARACRLFARLRDTSGVEPHLESFGGCMLGQLCPPSLLVAISVLEVLFFRQHGLRSVSLSYAQQTSPEQDLEALHALRTLADEFLGALDWHIVLYTYMGVYPSTRDGALRLLCDSAELAVRGGAARLIVKTSAEATRVPTIAANVEALELAGAVADSCRRSGPAGVSGVSGAAGAAASSGVSRPFADTGVLDEARALIEAVLGLDGDVGAALLGGVGRGYLDVPFCLHPDNPGRTRSRIGADGRLEWSDTGTLPLDRAARISHAPRIRSSELLTALSYMRGRYDRDLSGHPAHRALGRTRALADLENLADLEKET